MTESTITATSRFSAGGVEPEPLFATICNHRSGFYGCTNIGYTEGVPVLVGWNNTGDAPMSGDAARPKYGEIDYVALADPGCLYQGLVLLADAKFDIEVIGGFGGVSGGDASIEIQLRQNGTIIGSAYQGDPAPPGGAHGWYGSIQINMLDVEASAGDVFTLTVILSNWSGFEFFARNPGELYGYSHFEVTGVTVPGGRQFLRGHVTYAAEMAGGR